MSRRRLVHCSFQRIYIDGSHLTPHVHWQPIPSILPIPPIGAELSAISLVNLAAQSYSSRLDFLRQSFQRKRVQQLLPSIISMHHCIQCVARHPTTLLEGEIKYDDETERRGRWSWWGMRRGTVHISGEGRHEDARIQLNASWNSIRRESGLINGVISSQTTL